MAITLHSFQRYLNAGVNVAMGTDTFPMDMVAELRWASMLAKVTDQNYQAGQTRDVYNAATLAACKFLRRHDLGRLARICQGQPGHTSLLASGADLALGWLRA
jgi:cytosine/adenosine deaminase-related metal-dependent hydrolase